MPCGPLVTPTNECPVEPNVIPRGAQHSPSGEEVDDIAAVFLPGESQGRGSLVGCRLRGRTESDTTEAT